MKFHADVVLKHKQNPFLLHVTLALRGKSLNVLHEANVICLVIAHLGVCYWFDGAPLCLAYRNALRDHRLHCPKGRSLFWPQRQRFPHNFCQQRAALILYRRLSDFPYKISFALAPEWTLSMQHLIQDESKAPDIAFLAVNV